MQSLKGKCPQKLNGSFKTVTFYPQIAKLVTYINY